MWDPHVTKYINTQLGFSFLIFPSTRPSRPPVAQAAGAQAPLSRAAAQAQAHSAPLLVPAATGRPSREQARRARDSRSAPPPVCREPARAEGCPCAAAPLPAGPPSRHRRCPPPLSAPLRRPSRPRVRKSREPASRPSKSPQDLLAPSSDLGIFLLFT